MTLKLSRKEIVKKDKEFSVLVRSRGACEYCGKTTSLQCAHIRTRTIRATRWDEENALCLCVGCHIYGFHKDPAKYIEWIEKTFPGRLESLNEKVNASYRL